MRLVRAEYTYASLGACEGAVCPTFRSRPDFVGNGPRRTYCELVVQSNLLLRNCIIDDVSVSYKLDLAHNIHGLPVARRNLRSFVDPRGLPAAASATIANTALEIPFCENLFEEELA